MQCHGLLWVLTQCLLHSKDIFRTANILHFDDEQYKVEELTLMEMTDDDDHHSGLRFNVMCDRWFSFSFVNCRPPITKVL